MKCDNNDRIVIIYFLFDDRPTRISGGCSSCYSSYLYYKHLLLYIFVYLQIIMVWTEKGLRNTGISSAETKHIPTSNVASGITLFSRDDEVKYY